MICKAVTIQKTAKPMANQHPTSTFTYFADFLEDDMSLFIIEKHLPTGSKPNIAPVPPLKVSRMKRKTNWRAARLDMGYMGITNFQEISEISHQVMISSASKYVGMIIEVDIQKISDIEIYRNK